MKASEHKLSRLGEEIQGHLQRLNWSGSELERQAGLSVGTVSRLSRGLMTPTHETVEKIADALRVDALHLKEVAGLRVVTPPAQRDSRVEYIAQRLEELPFEVREEAIQAIGGQLDAIYKIVGLTGRERIESHLSTKTGDDTELQHLIEELVDLAQAVRDKQPDALLRIFEELSQQLPPQGPGDNPEPPSGQQRKAS